jgi:hypothetical protein
MTFTVTHASDLLAGRYAVTVKVSLSLPETNSLFLSGDSIISWPEGDLLAESGRVSETPLGAEPTGLVRTGMFVSELARLAEGLRIGYRQRVEAERAAHLIRLQLLKAGIEEET